MFGSNCLKTYSQTQETIALSSRESEFHGIVKAATMGVGIKSLVAELGLEIVVQANTDSSAARSISSRRGAWPLRHVEVRELKAQEKVRREELSNIKVKGEDNVADGLTKHVDRSKLKKHMKECVFNFRDGRHELCPYLGWASSSSGSIGPPFFFVAAIASGFGFGFGPILDSDLDLDLDRIQFCNGLPAG